MFLRLHTHCKVRLRYNITHGSCVSIGEVLTCQLGTSSSKQNNELNFFQLNFNNHLYDYHNLTHHDKNFLLLLNERLQHHGSHSCCGDHHRRHFCYASCFFAFNGFFRSILLLPPGGWAFSPISTFAVFLGATVYMPSVCLSAYVLPGGRFRGLRRSRDSSGCTLETMAHGVSWSLDYGGPLVHMNNS